MNQKSCVLNIADCRAIVCMAKKRSEKTLNDALNIKLEDYEWDAMHDHEPDDYYEPEDDDDWEE